jgi:hypothetical protein
VAITKRLAKFHAKVVSLKNELSASLEAACCETAGFNCNEDDCQE